MIGFSFFQSRTEFGKKEHMKLGHKISVTMEVAFRIAKCTWVDLGSHMALFVVLLDR